LQAREVGEFSVRQPPPDGDMVQQVSNEKGACEPVASEAAELRWRYRRTKVLSHSMVEAVDKVVPRAKHVGAERGRLRWRDGGSFDGITCEPIADHGERGGGLRRGGLEEVRAAPD